MGCRLCDAKPLPAQVQTDCQVDPEKFEWKWDDFHDYFFLIFGWYFLGKVVGIKVVLPFS